MAAFDRVRRKANNDVNCMPKGGSVQKVGESARLRKSVVLLTIACLSTILFLVSPGLSARPNGVGSGVEEYDCGGSCHDKASTAVMSMTSSNLTPAKGASITVTVNVSGSQSGLILGVMIVSSLSPVPASTPSASGWVITADPAGDPDNNYYEMTNYAGLASLTWTVTAPSTDGTYTLYARVMHGASGSSTVEYAEDYKSGLSFAVGSTGTPGYPDVIITSPLAGEAVKGSVTVNANIPSSLPIAYASIRLDGTEIGNKTTTPFSWDIDTRAYADGNHIVNITAVDTAGHAGYQEVTMKIDNSAVNEEMIAWIWTMAAGSIAIIAWTGVLVVIALMIRRRHIEKGGKK